MAAAKSHNFTAADLEVMTIGMIVDVFSEYIPENNRIKMATQEDIERYL